jgi:hypothetical protein
MNVVALVNLAIGISSCLNQRGTLDEELAANEEKDADFWLCRAAHGLLVLGFLHRRFHPFRRNWSPVLPHQQEVED